jgi:hypothetical protein
VIASLWEPVLAGLLAFVAFAMVATVAGGFLLWRYGRRRWRAFRTHGAVIGATALWEATGPARNRARGPMSADDAAHWPARRVRKELWRAVDQAEAAVRTADEVGGPTASLPSLCRQLRSAAAGIDKILRVDLQGPVPVEVATQAAEVVRAADDLRRAAVASAGDATGQQVRDLTSEADHEIRLLDAGLSSVQAVLPRRQG